LRFDFRAWRIFVGSTTLRIGTGPGIRAGEGIGLVPGLPIVALLICDAA
jgi:hypothetical protein